MRTVSTLLLVLVLPRLALAQTPAPEAPPPPPPLVDAPQAPPAPAPAPDAQLGTPPPPGMAPAAPATSYPYTPWGPGQAEPPGPEVGLMFTESAFGMLSAAGSSLLMYYLLLKPLGSQLGASGDAATLSTVLFLLGFSAVPMAVAQTELNLANGSRYYYSESWPASLSGLGAQAAVIGLYYLARPNTGDAGEAVLLLGTIVAVPLVEMAVINLTKQPRLGAGGMFRGAALSLNEDGAWTAGIPLPSPVPVWTSTGPTVGLGLQLLSGRF